MVSPSSRKTDRFAEPGEYAEAGIPLFWRVETDPALVLHPFVLGADGGEAVAPVRDRGTAPVPSGSLDLELTALRR